MTFFYMKYTNVGGFLTYRLFTGSYTNYKTNRKYTRSGRPTVDNFDFHNAAAFSIRSVNQKNGGLAEQGGNGCTVGFKQAHHLSAFSSSKLDAISRRTNLPTMVATVLVAPIS